LLAAAGAIQEVGTRKPRLSLPFGPRSRFAGRAVKRLLDDTRGGPCNIGRDGFRVGGLWCRPGGAVFF